MRPSANESEATDDMADKSLPETVAQNAAAVVASASAAVTSAKESAAELVRNAGDSAGKYAGQLSDSKDKVAGSLADGKDRLLDTTAKLSDRVADTRDKLADTTGRLADRLNDTGNGVTAGAKTGVRIVRENPLGLVLSGLAVGFLAGVLAPVSEVERERLAPLRDELVDRAQRAADDVVQHGRSVFEETAAAVTASASKHGQALAEELQTIATQKGEAPASPPDPA